MAVAVTEADSMLGRAIRPSVVVYALLAWGLLALWPTGLTLFRDWSEKTDYQHGSLVALVSAVWLWTARRELDCGKIRPSIWCGALLIGVLVAWAIAFRSNNDMGQQLLLPLALWLAAAGALGWRAALPLAAPLGYLYCAMTVWDYAIPLLQRMTVFVAETSLGSIGIPVRVEGNRVQIPEGTFEIAEGCAGKRYLLVAVALGYLAGATTRFNWQRRVVLLMASAALALAANWIRVVIVIYAGHVTDMQHHWVRVEHLTLGWIVFIPLFAAIFGVLAVLHRGMRSASETVSTRRPEPVRGIYGAKWMIVLTAVILSMPFWPRYLTAMQATTAPQLGVLPLSVGQWQGPLPTTADWRPRFAGQSDERQVSYRSAHGVIDVYINVFGRQNPGRELVYYTNSLLPEEWSEHSQRLTPLASGAGVQVLPAEIEASDVNGKRWLISYVYKTGRWMTGSATMVQLLYGAESLLSAPPSGILALVARCNPDCAAARQLLQEFWPAHGGALSKAIPDGFQE